ncbi:DNA alkylation repair protein [Brachyspira murdochii]|uniref:DNA alkylation repair protein n=1 Tax=Brachyspira murdochii TaxID=84378 RepID=UPI003005371E
MKDYIKNLEKEFSKITNGFKQIEKKALYDLKSNNNSYIKELAYTAYKSDSYQVRMYSVFLFGYLSEKKEILNFMKDVVSKDNNWRVQEILAKSFDEHCKMLGYEKSTSIIDEWLNNSNPNTRRAVTEGLRIWTNKPYFKENPSEAIKRLSNLKHDNSEYVRKSEGNALRDISKKYPKLIEEELNSWNLEIKEIKQVYKLANKFIKQ